MARNANIPVKSVHGHTLFYVTMMKALDMLREKDAAGNKLYRDTTHWIHGKGRPMPVLQFNAPLKEDSQSPCSIPASQVEANAGVDGSQSWQRRVRDKIQAWPHIHDNLAVCVGPRLA
jgi:hypothetical protein